MSVLSSLDWDLELLKWLQIRRTQDSKEFNLVGTLLFVDPWSMMEYGSIRLNLSQGFAGVGFGPLIPFFGSENEDDLSSVQ